MTERAEKTRVESRRARMKGQRTGRMLMVFKAVVLLALLGVTAYGMLNRGLFGEERWLPVAVGILGLLFVTLFVRAFFRDVPRVGWVLVGLLAVLVGIKGLSMIWTISEIETVKELIRSSMYLAAFVLALAALASRRQLAPLLDVSVLIVAAVAGYGLLQKIDPVNFAATTPQGVRVGSTLEYANTAAVVVGMGVVLGLARLTEIKRPLWRALYAVLLLVFCVVLYFTFSRGGILACGVGLAALFALGSHRLQMLANLALVGAPLAWVVWRAQDLGALFSETASQAERVAAGLELRADLILAVIAAFALQFGYALVVERYELLPPARRALGVAALAGVLLVFAAGTYSLVGERLLSGDLSEDVAGRMEGDTANERLTSVSSNSREQYWRVAWENWLERPLTGTGAGTFQYSWLQDRPGFGGVQQVHNVYLEQGTETGLFAFLALAGFAALLVGYAGWAAWRAPHGSDRRLALAGLSAALVVYLFSSAFEWHWYIPPSTLFFFILAGLTVRLAASEDQPREVPAENPGESPTAEPADAAGREGRA